MTSGSGKSPGEGNGNLLQYSCLITPMDRGAWWATVRGVVKSDATEHAFMEETLGTGGDLKMVERQYPH